MNTYAIQGCPAEVRCVYEERLFKGTRAERCRQVLGKASSENQSSDCQHRAEDAQGGVQHGATDETVGCTNLFESVSFVEVPERDPLSFSSPGFERLLQCIKENWLREIVVFAVLTGMRRGELLNL